MLIISVLNLFNHQSWVDRDMFMRYSGGGIGHQYKSVRWRSADRGNEEDEIDVDAEPEPYDGQIPTDDDGALHTLKEIATHLQENEDAGAETESSDSGGSSSSDLCEEEFDYGTDDDEDGRAYFGPEDDEPMDSDEDEM